MQVEYIKIIDKIVFKVYTLELREDGILHVHISGETYGIEELKALVPVIGKITNFQAIPMLLTLDEKASPDSEVRAFWAKKDSCPYVSAEAYIITNFAHKLLGNFYLKFNNPGRPTRLFGTEEEAYLWLRKFL
jgi:hypothetical protein